MIPTATPTARMVLVCALAVAAACGQPPAVEEPSPEAVDSVPASTPEAVPWDSATLPWIAAPEPYATDGTMPFFYDLYTFRGDDSATVVVASFAVRAGELQSRRVDDGARYRFSVGLTVADPRTGGVFPVHDSVYLIVPEPLHEDHLLHAFVQTRAPPSPTTVQRVVMLDAQHPANGQLYSASFPIPDYTGDALMLSDIALGLPDRPGGWPRGAARLALLPGDYFPGGDFDVFYEVYNLPAGHRYTTEIAFAPVADPRGDPDPALPDPVRVRFDGTSDAVAGLLRERRGVTVPADPGRYRMTVIVTDLVTGRAVRASRRLRIRHWGENATLVPTCPDRMGETRPGC